MTQNVDKEEIANFSRLAEQWWDPKGSLKTLHHINPIRLQYIQKYTPLMRARLLDLGCGGGILTEAMAQLGATVTAIDMEPEAIAVAKAHAADTNLSIDYQHISVQKSENIT